MIDKLVYSNEVRIAFRDRQADKSDSQGTIAATGKSCRVECSPLQSAAGTIHLKQPLPAKDRYLSKKYSHSHLSHYERFQGRDRASPQKMLEKHLEKSRLKIKAHRNELKQLDQLVKKRNKIRLIKLKEQSDQKRTITADPLKQSPKKEISKTFYDHFDNSSKIEKEKREHSTFAGIRGDRVLDIVQESKAMGLATEEAVGFLKKQLKIGI